MTSPDSLYFMHVPRTGGTTLIALLDSQFASEEIFPAQLWQEAIRLVYLRDLVRRSRLIRGHFGPGLAQLRTPLPPTITVLRHPVARTISEYQYILQSPENPDYHRLCEEQKQGRGLLEIHWLRRQLANAQTKYLGKAFNPITRTDAELTETEALVSAQKTLEDCFLVGVMEHFEAFIQLLFYRMGWPLPPEIPHLNPSIERPALQHLEAALYQQIMEDSPLDMILYESALETFKRQYQTMLRELDALPLPRPAALMTTAEKLAWWSLQRKAASCQTNE